MMVPIVVMTMILAIVATSRTAVTLATTSTTSRGRTTPRWRFPWRAALLRRLIAPIASTCIKSSLVQLMDEVFLISVEAAPLEPELPLGSMSQTAKPRRERPARRPPAVPRPSMTGLMTLVRVRQLAR